MLYRAENWTGEAFTLFGFHPVRISLDSQIFSSLTDY